MQLCIPFMAGTEETEEEPTVSVLREVERMERGPTRRRRKRTLLRRKVVRVKGKSRAVVEEEQSMKVIDAI